VAIPDTMRWYKFDGFNPYLLFYQSMPILSFEKGKNLNGQYNFSITVHMFLFLNCTLKAFMGQHITFLSDIHSLV
jgi:hypothetical protein